MVVAEAHRNSFPHATIPPFLPSLLPPVPPFRGSHIRLRHRGPLRFPSVGPLLPILIHHRPFYFHSPTGAPVLLPLGAKNWWSDCQLCRPMRQALGGGRQAPLLESRADSDRRVLRCSSPTTRLPLSGCVFGFAFIRFRSSSFHIDLQAARDDESFSPLSIASLRAEPPLCRSPMKGGPSAGGGGGLMGYVAFSCFLGAQSTYPMTRFLKGRYLNDYPPQE